MQHLIDKWDSYLGKLFGLLLVAIAAFSVKDPKLLALFRYFLFIMIAVAVFDVIRHWGSHESPFWHVLATASNAFTIAACIFLLQQMYGMEMGFKLASLSPVLSAPLFNLYLGAAIFAENLLWSYVYDHL